MENVVDDDDDFDVPNKQKLTTTTNIPNHQATGDAKQEVIIII